MKEEDFLRKIERLGAIFIDLDLPHTQDGKEAQDLAIELRREARHRLGIKDPAAPEITESHFPWVEVD